jgi:hypothetical protein
MGLIKLSQLSFIGFQGLLIALVHTLTDAGHYRSGHIEGGVQHFLRYTFFPGVRQASIDSRLAVSNDGNGYPDQRLLTICEKLGGMGIMIVFSKVRFFTHKIPPV